MKKYHAIAAGLLIGTTLMLGATPAMARVDVGVNIGIPGLYVQPAPVYVQPQPYYVEPEPVYVQPRPVYVQPQPVYIEQRGWREHQWREHRRHEWRDHDRDGDGVPNRYDSRPDNPYRR